MSSATSAWTGAYPERAERDEGALDRSWRRLRAVLRPPLPASRLQGFVASVHAHAGAAAALGSTALAVRAAELGRALARQRRLGLAPQTGELFALVREAATRTFDQRHFEVQLVGGLALLEGHVVEMETGEGKTLTATLAAASAALAGIPTHVITANDYLAARDASQMRPLFAALGLEVGLIQHGLAARERRAAYARPITYASSKQLAFDYLRDRCALRGETSRARLHVERLLTDQARLHGLVLRGLHYAIVDEADSVLVDEARTPLVLSSGGDSAVPHDVCQHALALARELCDAEHYVLEAHTRRARLSAAGRSRLAELADALPEAWRSGPRREFAASLALSALHLFRRDRDYIVDGQRIEIVDEYTGRRMPDRAWERGLHALIEAKEGVAARAPEHPVARMTYPRIFRRYLRLAGMTGTAREVRAELASVYGLDVVRILPHRPLRRRDLGERVFATATEKWQALVERVAELHGAGVPVLVGTQSVEASEALGRRLLARGLPHRVLNARQDGEEAGVVADAGQPGQITVATQMAGRGTDIRLGSGVAERGGLHVIASERHESRRLDRQLFGRCGRQGDPGRHEAFASLEDDLLRSHGLVPARWVARGPWLAHRALDLAQRRAERTHARARRRLLEHDRQLDAALAFSGKDT
jgi:preprotein translocase subunit SecA